MRTARILVPPGIGDGYWVLVKLRGFLERQRIGRAQVWIHDAGPRRAHEMWKHVPFVEFGGYAPVPRSKPNSKKPMPGDVAALRAAYTKSGYPAQRNVCGFDYLLSFNGSLAAGQSLDQAMTGPANWYETAFDPVAMMAQANRFRAWLGNYIACAFWDHGFYHKFVAQFGEPAIIETLRALADAGKTVVLMGAEWDKGGIAERLAAADPRFVNLVGGTDFHELAGLLAGSDAVVGFPAGNTLLGPYFRRPTVLIWNDHFPRAMWLNALPPDARNYYALDTRTVTPEWIVERALGLLAEAAA